MEFIKQLIAFDRLRFGNLTPNAIAVYMHLFMANNRCGWEEWFEESDQWIEMGTGIRRRETIVAALNLLKQKGFIDYIRSKGGWHSVSKYCILPLSTSGDHSGETSGDHSGETSGDHSGETSGESVSPLINSKNRIRLREERETRARATPVDNSPGKFIPPTRSEVRSYIREKGYNVDADTFCEYYEATGWKDANGKPVKSWKGKLVTWNSHEKSGNRPLSVHEQTMANARALMEKWEARDNAGKSENTGDSGEV